ncbi:GTP-binding protein, partial [bacterium]
PIEKTLADIEARVDFSEELGELDIPASRKELEIVRTDLAQLREGARATRLAREGARIAIMGPPNAGKSSLLNALVRRDRALVTPYAGTTRDTIEEAIEVAGLRLVLVDTAGLRETEDPVEALGVERSRREGRGADLVWYVYDSADGYPIEEFPPNALLIANKADLKNPDAGHPISATHRTGLDRLLEITVDRLAFAPPQVPISDRHALALAEADEALAGALETLRPDIPPDLAVTFLREALWSLGTITGETADEGLLERIFSGFCVGK